jgi:peptidyl-prolyl cis-trans isomerase C
MKFIFLTFSALSVFCAACTNTPHEDEEIARVNGRSITVKDYLGLYETLKPKDLSLGGKERIELKNLVLKNLVRRQVVLTESEKRKIQVSKQELENGIKKYKEDYGSGIFEQSLLEQMIDENEWKEQIRQNLLIEKLIGTSEPKQTPPSSREISAFYETNSPLFRKEASVVALHIVVNDKKLAEDIRSQLRTKSFLELAKKFSLGPEAQTDAKIRITKGVMPDTIDRALFDSQSREISPVIVSPYGFHIFKIVERKPAINLDFIQVKDEIARYLLQQQRDHWLTNYEGKLLKNASIEYNRKLIEKL